MLWARVAPLPIVQQLSSSRIDRERTESKSALCLAGGAVHSITLRRQF